MAVLGRPRSLLKILIFVAVGLLQVRSAQAQGGIEYELKAAFLNRLTEFVDWPPDAFSSETAPLRICIFGPDPFGATLDRALEGERMKGHGLVAVRVTQLEQLGGCHVVFIGRLERDRIAAAVNILRDRPVLTVSDTDNFLEQGGTLNFVTAGNRLSFDINTAAADRAGLQLSSKLLRLARVIRRK